MDAIERITQMEKRFDEIEPILRRLDEDLEAYLRIQESLNLLVSYYGSPQWLKDYDADAAGAFPADLKRGILSEDGIYDLIMQNRRLLEQMRKISGE